MDYVKSVEFFKKLIPFSSSDLFSSFYNLSILLLSLFCVLYLEFKIGWLGKKSNIKKQLLTTLAKLNDFQRNQYDRLEEIKDIFDEPDLKEEWREYESTLVKRTYKESPIVYKTEHAETYFNEDRILARRLNVRFWHALPGILVGLGILGTFLGLTYGLSQFKTGSSQEIENSTKELISGMYTAFTTSVWGILLSILFNFYEKWRFSGVSRSLYNLNNQIDKLFSITKQEEISFKQQDELEQQTKALKQFSTDLADKIKIAMGEPINSRLDEVRNAIEKLYESSEKSTTLVVDNIRSFGAGVTRELRDAVGSVMVEKLAPSLEKVSQSIGELAPIVESLRNEKHESTIEAISKLVNEFRTNLSSVARSELERLAGIIENTSSILSAFPDQFDKLIKTTHEQLEQTKTLMESSSHKIQEEFNSRVIEMGNIYSGLVLNLKDSLAEQQKIIKETASNIAQDASSATALMREETEKAIQSFGDTIRSVQDNFAKLLERQISSAGIVEDLIENFRKIQGDVNGMVASTARAIEQINEAVDKISALSHTFSSSSTFLKESGENLKLVTERLIEHNDIYLKKSNEIIDEILKLAHEYSSKFSVIEKGLKEIFAQIQNGLNEYSSKTRETINEYLSAFSSHLTGASQNLAAGVEQLANVVDEIDDILDSFKK